MLNDDVRCVASFLRAAINSSPPEWISYGKGARFAQKV